MPEIPWQASRPKIVSCHPEITLSYACPCPCPYTISENTENFVYGHGHVYGTEEVHFWMGTS